MKRRHISFILAVLILLYGCQTIPVNLTLPDSSISQDQPTSAATKKAAELASDTVVQDTPPLSESGSGSMQGEAESQGSTPGTSPDKKTFGGWEVECGPAGTDCAATIRVKAKNGSQIFGLMIQEEKKEGAASKPVVTAWLPLGILLPAPVKVSIGESSNPFLLLTQFCWSEGCLAVSDTPDSFIAALNEPGPGKISVSMIEYNSRKLKTFSFTQSGFTEAYQYMLKRQ